MFIFRWLKKFWLLLVSILSWFNKTILIVLEILLIAGVCLLIYTMTSAPEVKNDTVLVLDLEGELQEETQVQTALSSSVLGQIPGTSLRDVLQVLDTAAKDPRIDGVLLKLDGVDKAGLASLSEVGLALDRFKSSGKPVWAWGTNFSQEQYAIAAHANEIYVHPMGQVIIKGLSSSRLYYGDLLKSLGVTIHVFKAGDFKSYPESFTERTPSRQWIESERYWLTDAWRHLSSAIENARGLMPGSVNQFINTLPERIEQTHGNMAQTALNASLIDGVKTYDEMISHMETRLGRNQPKDINLMSYLDYVPNVPVNISSRNVAVVIAEGEIRDGQSEPGIIGAETLVEMLEAIEEDPSISAVVLRLNSPGGSAVASELIRHALVQLRQKGKPVVVSMSDVAASGGYWISAGATEIIASETTLTGSIGVFGLAPTFENSLSLAKIGQGRVSTNWLAGADKPTQTMDSRLARILNSTVERTYDDFCNIVGQARKLNATQVQAVAQGRVWTGAQALERKLVDRVGSFDDALARARELGKLPAGSGVIYYGTQPSDMGSWVKGLARQWNNPLGLVTAQLPLPAQESVRELKTVLETSFKDGQYSVFAHSLVDGQSIQ